MRSIVTFMSGRTPKLIKYLLLCAMLCPTLLFAQTKAITGTVNDETGLPLPGVSVVIKNTPGGTQTDEKGKFSIKAAQGAIIVFSYIGFNKEEITVDAKDSYIIALTPAANNLKEVVIGYTTVKQKDLTGSVSVVSKEQIQNRPVTNALAALQGTVPGLVITRQTGQPGQEGYAANIRGESSINAGAGNAPLVLIDGVEGDPTLINPDDIENVSVLKDAAAAIYGAKAGGGVILITTKKGTKQVVVNYTGLFTMQKRYNSPAALSSWQVDSMTNMAQRNSGQTPQFTARQLSWMMNADSNRYTLAANGVPTYYYNTNYPELLMRKVSGQYNQNLSVSGGTDKSTYFFSLSYVNQDGIFKIGADSYKRYNGRFSFNTKLSKVFTFDSKLSLATTNTLAPPMSIGGDGLFYWMYAYTNQNIPLTVPGTNLFPNSVNSGYAALAGGGYWQTQQYNFNGVFTLSANGLVKGLNLRVLYSPGLLQGNQNNFLSQVNLYNPTSAWAPGVAPTTALVSALNTGGSLQKTRATTLNQTVNLVGEYNYRAGGHSFYLMGGFEYKSYNYNYISAIENNLTVPTIPTLNYTTNNNIPPTNVSDNIQVNTWASLFSQLAYNYKEKYYLTATMREDGSSRLAPGNQTHFFPSIGGFWRPINEIFLKEPLSFFDDLKLKASWSSVGGAQTANPNGNNYDYQAVLNTGTYPFNNTSTAYVYQSVLPSTGKEWEVDKMTDVGIDAAMFNNRLTLGFDYYQKDNNNIFARLTSPAVLGVTPNSGNIASLRVRGWDLQVKWSDKFKNGGYFINVVLSDYNTLVTRYSGTYAYQLGPNAYLPGLPLNENFGYKADGYYQTAEQLADVTTYAKYNATVGLGDIKYLRQSGAPGALLSPGQQTAANHGDMVDLGNSDPHYSFGINLGANWKNFDISAFFQGVLKRKMFMSPYYTNPFGQSYRSPIAYNWQNTWTPTNTNAPFPRLYEYGGSVNWNSQYSSFWIQNAAYIRLKNIQLGYTIPKLVLQKIGIQKVRIFFTGQDLWEKSGMWLKIFDAENPSNNGYNYPFMRAYAMGINATF